MAVKTVLGLALCFVCYVTAREMEGACFNFTGNLAFLEFTPYNFQISESMHFKLKFRTTSPDGILLYAGGSHDMEALHMSNGILYYDLINPTAWGTGGTFGAHFASNHRVNNNTWITVQIFRNRRLDREDLRGSRRQVRGRNMPIQTGMIIKGANTEVHVLREQLVLSGVNIIPPVFIGGWDRPQNQDYNNFAGQIRDVREKTNGEIFIDPTRNTGYVSRCLPSRRPS